MGTVGALKATDLREGRKLGCERTLEIGVLFGRPSTELRVFDKRPSYAWRSSETDVRRISTRVESERYADEEA